MGRFSSNFEDRFRGHVSYNINDNDNKVFSCIMNQ